MSVDIKKSQGHVVFGPVKVHGYSISKDQEIIDNQPARRRGRAAYVDHVLGEERPVGQDLGQLFNDVVMFQVYTCNL